MSKINYGRVAGGGLLAGLVLCVGEFLLSKPVLGARWNEVSLAHNLPAVGPELIPVFVAMNLVLGIALVCLYASIRPRYGAGPKTALRAGLIGWFFVWLYGYTVGTVLGVWPLGMTVIAAVWGLVEVPLAALAGASLYKEGD